MCLLAIFFRVFEDAPLVVGANREEAYDRGGLPPQRLDSGPLVAGLDPAAGGTWLGVSARGLLVAVTNRPRSRSPVNRRSRGQLVLDALRQPNAQAAADLAAREWAGDRYDGFNLVCASATSAVIVQAGDWLRVRPLPPGLHLLTNRDVNDPNDPRIRRVLELLHADYPQTSAEAADRLQTICGATDGETAICRRGEHRGTVCSSVLVLARDPDRSRFLHAAGPPDRTPYADLSELLTPVRV